MEIEKKKWISLGLFQISLGLCEISIPVGFETARGTISPGTQSAVTSKQDRRSGAQFRTKQIETKTISGIYQKLGNQALIQFWFKNVNIYLRLMCMFLPKRIKFSLALYGKN